MNLKSSPVQTSAQPEAVRVPTQTRNRPRGRILNGATRTALLAAVLQMANTACLTEFPPRGDNPDYTKADTSVDTGVTDAENPSCTDCNELDLGNVDFPDVPSILPISEAGVGFDFGSIEPRDGEVEPITPDSGVENPDARVITPDARVAGDAVVIGDANVPSDAFVPPDAVVVAPDALLADALVPTPDAALITPDAAVLPDAFVVPLDAATLVDAEVDSTVDAAIQPDMGPVCVPHAEVCNGIDDDCDGVIDNNSAHCDDGQPCSRGEGACRGDGTMRNGVCNAVAGDPQAETCNGEDDDCNGVIDDGADRACSTACSDGTQVCIDGQLQPCDAIIPTADICDGNDNDCNGVADDNDICSEGLPCTNGTGACAREGTIVNGMCNAVPGDRAGETCNGIDDDCDGQVDETYPQQNQEVNDHCRFGACSTGTQLCINGALVTQFPTPVGEVLNNDVDDDCDGSVDEGSPQRVQQGWDCSANRPNDCNQAPRGQNAASQSCDPVAGELDCYVSQCVCTAGRANRTAECGCANPPCDRP